MSDSLDRFRKLYILVAAVSFLLFAIFTYIEGSYWTSAMMAVGALFSVMLSYRYYRELKAGRSIEDERFSKINRKSALIGFFTTIVAALISGGTAAVLRNHHSMYAEWLTVYDTALVAAVGGITFLLAQIYYIHYGTEGSFWSNVRGEKK